ncbi:MAG TPA: hypothetical protein VGD07_13545 [Methylomirabilota bacterium]
MSPKRPRRWAGPALRCYSLAEALQAGFAAYLPKPLQYAEVCRAILAATRPPS